MSDPIDIQTGEISHERLRTVFKGVLEQFVTDVIAGRVEIDPVLPDWIRD